MYIPDAMHDATGILHAPYTILTAGSRGTFSRTNINSGKAKKLPPFRIPATFLQHTAVRNFNYSTAKDAELNIK